MDFFEGEEGEAVEFTRLEWVVIMATLGIAVFTTIMVVSGVWFG